MARLAVWPRGMKILLAVLWDVGTTHTLFIVLFITNLIVTHLGLEVCHYPLLPLLWNSRVETFLFLLTFLVSYSLCVSQYD